MISGIIYTITIKGDIIEMPVGSTYNVPNFSKAWQRDPKWQDDIKE